MSWTTPTLRQVRTMVRDDITAALSGAVLVGNSVLRVMSDVNAGLAHLVLRYIDWLARQLLPDTAEVEWLDRHGDIWLTNADNSIGRKSASYASGSISFTGTNGIVVPNATQLLYLGVHYETTQQITIGTSATIATARATDAGVVGNLVEGDTVDLVDAIAGVDGQATIVEMLGGADEETDDELRARVLFRIRNPPMGGDKADYEIWATQVPGVTRAWAAPLEMGIGTVTVRFMMDDLRADGHGLPLETDIETVAAHLDSVRPVAVKDFFVVAPLPLFYDLSIGGLVNDSEAVRAAIEASIKAMERVRTAPGITMYRSWIDEAISAAVGEDHHELLFDTTTMPSPGHLAILGTISYF